MPLSSTLRRAYPQYFSLSLRGRICVTDEALDRIEQRTRASGLDFDSPNSVARTIRRYAGSLENIEYLVSDLRCLKNRVQNRWVYWLHLEARDHNHRISSGTPVRLKACSAIHSSTFRRPVDGVILGTDDTENAVYFMTPEDCGQVQLPARLAIDKGFLLTELADRVDSLTSTPARFKPIVTAGDANSISKKLTSSNEVAENLLADTGPTTRLLWGPPGAGKTYALGQYVAKYVQRHPRNRVLLLAPSNLAADVLMTEVVQALRRCQLEALITDRTILRFGYARMPSILKCAAILGSTAQEEITTAIGRITAELEQKKRESDNEAIIMLRGEQYVRREELRKAVAEHVSQCTVVTTTTTLGYLSSSPITNQVWDLVVVDEVTMATPGLLYFISSLAQDTLLLAGDPRQLGPVFEETDNTTVSERTLMGQDIFALSGIVDVTISSDAPINDNTAILYRIMEQRRCHPSIWRTISSLYKGVNINLHGRKSFAEDFCDIPRLVICETSECVQSNCSKRGKSWENKYSAELAVRLARTSLRRVPEASVGIITPFGAQAQLIESVLEDSYRDEDDRNDADRISVGTVHRFQGSSADIVIFDLVCAPDKPSSSPLFAHYTGTRLMTVAFSRAKEQLIIICDTKWFRAHSENQSSNLLLSSLTRSGNPRCNNTVRQFLSLGGSCQDIQICTFTGQDSQDMFSPEMV